MYMRTKRAKVERTTLLLDSVKVKLQVLLQFWSQPCTLEVCEIMPDISALFLSMHEDYRGKQKSKQDEIKAVMTFRDVRGLSSYTTSDECPSKCQWPYRDRYLGLPTSHLEMKKPLEEAVPVPYNNLQWMLWPGWLRNLWRRHIWWMDTEATSQDATLWKQIFLLLQIIFGI